jgi:hypothetical protein
MEATHMGIGAWLHPVMLRSPIDIGVLIPFMARVTICTHLVLSLCPSLIREYIPSISAAGIGIHNSFITLSFSNQNQLVWVYNNKWSLSYYYYIIISIKQFYFYSILHLFAQLLFPDNMSSNLWFHALVYMYI